MDGESSRPTKRKSIDRPWLQSIGGIEGLHARRHRKVASQNQSGRRASTGNGDPAFSPLRLTRSVDDLVAYGEKAAINDSRPIDDGSNQSKQSSKEQERQEEQEWDFDSINFGDQTHCDVDPYTPPLPSLAEDDHIERIEYADKENSVLEAEDSSAIVDENKFAAEPEAKLLSATSKQRSASDLLIMAREALNDQRERFDSKRLVTPSTDPATAALLECVTREYEDRLKSHAKLKRREEDLREDWMAEFTRNHQLLEDLENAKDSVARLHILVTNLSDRNEVLENKADADEEELDAAKDQITALRHYIGVHNDTLTDLNEWITRKRGSHESSLDANDAQSIFPNEEHDSTQANSLDHLLDKFINHNVDHLGEDIQLHHHLLIRLFHSPFFTSQPPDMSSEENREALSGTQIDELQDTVSDSSPSSSRRSSPNARSKPRTAPVECGIDAEELQRRREARKAEFRIITKQREEEEEEAKVHAEERRAYWARKFGFVALEDE